MDVRIKSEIGKISKVIVHKPGWFHDNMHPDNIQEYLSNGEKNPNYLLFDDLIDTQLAIKEHKMFTDILKLFTGKDGCVDLLHDIGSNSKLNDLSDQVLPNMIFTRDLGVVIGNKILIPWASKKVRNFENELTSKIFKKYFNNHDIIEFHDLNPDTSLEGGDITIFNEDLILIGISERTTKEAIHSIQEVIFNEGFNRIYAVELPKKRSMMHIDTVLTKINHDEVIYFSPLFDEHKPNIYNIKRGESINSVKPLRINLIEMLNSDGYKTRGIKCGGNININQYREQWTDGANAFCLQPGISIGYNRNYHTIEELKRNGYKIVNSEDFIINFNNETDEKIFITINSSELCRGRGGPRCLTLPVYRESDG